MSETLFAAPATESEAPPVVPVEETPDKDQRRKMLAMVGAGVVAVVAIAGFFVMKGGSDDTAAALPPVHHKPAAPAAPQGKFDAKAFPTLPDVFKDVVGRDPFKPLVVDKPAAPAQAPAPTSVVVAQPGAPTGAPTVGTPVASTQPDWISLESQNGVKSATFLVHSTDGKAIGYTDVAAPADGKTTAFGTYFALISLQDGFAVVQMGDGKPFNVEVGYNNRHMLN